MRARTTVSAVSAVSLSLVGCMGCHGRSIDASHPRILEITRTATARTSVNSPSTPGLGTRSPATTTELPATCGTGVPCPPPGASHATSVTAVCQRVAANPASWAQGRPTLSPTGGVKPRLLASYASTAGSLSRWDYGDPTGEYLAIWWPDEAPSTPAALCYLAGQFRTTDGRRFTTAIIEVVANKAKLTLAGQTDQTILFTAPPPA
jgi:hypothetical protein